MTTSEYNKAYYKKNREALRQYRIDNKPMFASLMKSWRKQNPIEDMLLVAKRRARSLKREYDLTLEDIRYCPLYCEVTGEKLDYLKSKGILHRNSAALDRIDNTKGYIKGNIRIISQAGNTIKRNINREGKNGR